MFRSLCLVIVSALLLICFPVTAYCHAAGDKLELAWDFLAPTAKTRDLDTVSMHIFDKISATKNRSVYRGITITRVRGNILPKDETQRLDSSAFGIGPVYMVRNERCHSGKLTAAVDMSGGFIIYNKRFPAGGEHYNFMWRIGPQFIYRFSPDSSVNVGYMFMHVSNGLHQNQNPSYNAHGITFSFVTKF